MDQPLYALCKQFQWNWPETHGEGKFVLVMGGLHIENVALKLQGEWLDKSGWTYMKNSCRENNFVQKTAN